MHSKFNITSKAFSLRAYENRVRQRVPTFYLVTRYCLTWIVFSFLQTKRDNAVLSHEKLETKCKTVADVEKEYEIQ